MVFSIQCKPGWPELKGDKCQETNTKIPKQGIIGHGHKITRVTYLINLSNTLLKAGYAATSI
jgi:hypothetical protein